MLTAGLIGMCTKCIATGCRRLRIFGAISELRLEKFSRTYLPTYFLTQMIIGDMLLVIAAHLLKLGQIPEWPILVQSLVPLSVTTDFVAQFDFLWE